MVLVDMTRVIKQRKDLIMHSWILHLQVLTQDLKKSELMVLGYKTGLKSVEERLELFKTNKSIYLEDIKVFKVEIQLKEIAIRELRKNLEIAQKEKDVPPPYTGYFMPPTPDLSFTGLDEFVNKLVVENNNEEENATQPKIEKKIVRPSIVKKELVKSKQQEKTARKTVKQVDQPRQNTHSPRDYEEIDGGYVAFRGNSKGGKIIGKRLDYLNFKTMNELVKGNLVRGLPSKLFENDQACVACQKGKQHRSSFVTDDYSRFTWAFFLATKDETSGILKSFITRIENLGDHKVKAEEVNTAWYVQNRVLVVKPHNKTSYELFNERTPTLSFMRPFGCPITTLNTIDHLGKFDGKADDLQVFTPF
nr:hypothetical protein [Tanacetum cinerariifolium]